METERILTERILSWMIDLVGANPFKKVMIKEMVRGTFTLQF